MKFSINIYLGALYIVVLLAGCGKQNDEPVYGVVYDGTALEKMTDVKVSLFTRNTDNSLSDTIESVFTDAAGEFYFEHLTDGYHTYKVVAEEKDYFSETSTVLASVSHPRSVLYMSPQSILRLHVIAGSSGDISNYVHIVISNAVEKEDCFDITIGYDSTFSDTTFYVPVFGSRYNLISVTGSLDYSENIFFHAFDTADYTVNF